MTKSKDDLSARYYDATRDFIIDECVETGRGTVGDWQACIADALKDLDRAVYHPNVHPDVVMRIQQAVSSLSGIWLTDDEKDARYSAIEAAWKAGR